MPITTLPAYSNSPLPRTHTPPKQRPYDQYRECLRLEFDYTCVYCLAHESEVGLGAEYGGFEIEHFKPRHLFKSLTNFYPNLLWACRACNQAKQTWPDGAEVAAGYRYVDPCGEALGDHLELVGEKIKTVAGSNAGAYMITEIFLDGEIHEKRRTKRADRMTRFKLLEAIYEQLKLKAQDPDVVAEAARVEAEMIEVRPSIAPWDAPTTCRCSSPARKSKRQTRAERKAARMAAIDVAKRAAGKPAEESQGDGTET